MKEGSTFLHPLNGITYYVERVTPQPGNTGRLMHICSRPTGRRKYVIFQYEDGSLSKPSPAPKLGSPSV